MAVQVAGEQLGTGSIDERTILDGAVKLVDLNSEVTARLTPSLSGHSDGQILTIVTGAPEWADPAAASVRLDQVLDPTASKTFSMTTYPLEFTYTVPANAPAVSIHTTGNVGTGALHVHQSAGVPAVPVDLVYFEGSHKDVLPLRIVSLNDYSIAVDKPIQINIASGPIAPLSLSAACTAKVTYLNADQVDGADASATPTASTIPIADGAGKLAAGWGGSASTLATLNVSTKVVEDPANAQTTAAQNKIPIGLNAAAPFLATGWFSPQTTKGDLVVYSTVPARLAVGANDYPLIAASGETTGVKWAILPIAGGGTGQVTATAAFDALSPTTTKGDLIVYTTASARLAVGTDDSVLEAYSGDATYGVAWRPKPVKTIWLSGNQTNSTTAWADCTGLSFAVASGKTYKFRATIIFSSAATTTGIGLGMNGPTASLKAIRTRIPTSYVQGTDAELTEQVSNWDSGTATTGVNTATTNYLAEIEGICTTTASGTLIVRFKSEVDTSTVTIKAGSHLELWMP